MRNNLGSLKQLVLKTSQWTLLGYGTNQAIRVLSHLVLARLLSPEDFGIASLIFVFIQGLQMFSDLGLGVNIIQYEQGDSPVFLRTVWTLQILRGAILWGATFIFAYPLAYLYDAQEIIWLFPFAGSSLFLSSFTSTNFWIYYRKMNIGRAVTIEVASTLLGTIAMLCFAWQWSQAWTLLTASIIFGVFRSIFSLVFIEGPSMAFKWDRSVVMQVVRFGRWIFISTMNTFLASRLDIVILGIFLDKSTLGLYGIASRLISLFTMALESLNSSMAIPFYSKIKAESISLIRSKVLRLRLLLTGLFLPIFYMLMIWGQDIVNFVYPPAYSQVGSFLRILAIGGAIQVTTETITPVLIANGDSFRHMLTQISRCFLLIIPMIIGGSYYGVAGLIGAIIVSPLLNYPVIILNVKRYGVWLPVLDFLALGASAVVAYIFLYGNSLSIY